jgi:hypothetical protein
MHVVTLTALHASLHGRVNVLSCVSRYVTHILFVQSVCKFLPILDQVLAPVLLTLTLIFLTILSLYSSSLCTAPL